VRARPHGESAPVGILKASIFSDLTQNSEQAKKKKGLNRGVLEGTLTGMNKRPQAYFRQK